MDTVDPLPGLADRVITGGRVNAAKAVAANNDPSDDAQKPQPATPSSGGGCFINAAGR